MQRIPAAYVRTCAADPLTAHVFRFARPSPSAAYFGFALISEKFGLGKTKAKKAKKADGPVVLDEDDWVKGTHYDVQKRRKAAAAKKA